MKRFLKNKKGNKKGFTLIELLAVIVIMGVLMFAAIASYTVIIENSRKSTFANTAAAYLEAIRQYELAGEVLCYPATSGVVNESSSASVVTNNGHYTFYIATNQTTVSDLGISGETIVKNMGILMSAGGKSSWSNADVIGYVSWTKSAGELGTQKTEYSVRLSDTNGHGMTAAVPEASINKNQIATSDDVPTALSPTTADTSAEYVCTLVAN